MLSFFIGVVCLFWYLAIAVVCTVGYVQMYICQKLYLCIDWTNIFSDIAITVVDLQRVHLKLCLSTIFPMSP